MFQTQDIKKKVRHHYAKLAESGSCCGRETSESSCCSDKAVHLQGIGYSEQALDSVPQDAVGVSAGCGNPTALAEITPGETVLDLGSGGGIDVLLAAKQVGSTGHVIGVDMTAAMIDKARQNAEKAGADNVEFRLGEIEQLPVEDGSVDLIISNCVINLSPDKDAVFAEAFRVLKRGGRLLVSDLVTVGELPEEIRKNAEAWAGCIAGTLKREVYLDKIRNAGFNEVRVLQESEALPNLPVVSMNVRAVKS